MNPSNNIVNPFEHLAKHFWGSTLTQVSLLETLIQSNHSNGIAAGPGSQVHLESQTRNPKPETRNPKPEKKLNPKPKKILNTKSETRNSNPASQNPKSELNTNYKSERRNAGGPLWFRRRAILRNRTRLGRPPKPRLRHLGTAVEQMCACIC